MIVCEYTCGLCGVVRAKVEVEERGEEDVIEWTTKVMTPALVRDHEMRSPNCHPKKFTEVYIPITGAKKIGGPAIQ